MVKIFTKLKYIPNVIPNIFPNSKSENVFSFNNIESKIMEFQNYFYLYNLNLALWKKNNTNNMNMPEEG
jgi:hypothetical protein